MSSCCKDKTNYISGKWKDVIELEGFSYTVYLTVCSCCGVVIGSESWIE